MGAEVKLLTGPLAGKLRKIATSKCSKAVPTIKERLAAVANKHPEAKPSPLMDTVFAPGEVSGDSDDAAEEE